jgi:hypothetical protein|uniref:Uncharacterized protein n=1 Tax=Myoviridae sp. ctIty1 TaxID=2827673 RepID=A0A8S5TGY7_9CAUD|nr:MAG TPA: hypothetical protein [Myoviridae sp. ctIty1]DAX86328.1 MAG TPA: hypothetical protein [Caudoviricetes sp.]
MLFDKSEGFMMNESHEPVVESQGAGIVDQDALLENMLIDQMNRMTDEEFQAYTESADFQNLVEAGVLGRRSVVKMTRKDDLNRRIHLASIQMAREQGDADWEALRKNRVNERRLLKKIYTKYSNRVRRDAMQSQKRLIKLTPDAFNFNKIGR